METNDKPTPTAHDIAYDAYTAAMAALDAASIGGDAAAYAAAATAVWVASADVERAAYDAASALGADGRDMQAGR